MGKELGETNDPCDYGGLRAQLSCFQNDGNFFKISLLTLFCPTGHPFWWLSTVKQKHQVWSAPLLKVWHQHPLQPLEQSLPHCVEKHPAMGTNKDQDSWLKGSSEGRAGRNGRKRCFWRRRTFRDFPLGKVFSFSRNIWAGKEKETWMRVSGCFHRMVWIDSFVFCLFPWNKASICWVAALCLVWRVEKTAGVSQQTYQCFPSPCSFSAVLTRAHGFCWSHSPPRRL